MPLCPYLNFDGNTREAIAFYENVFDTKADVISTFGEAPSNPDYPLPEEMKDMVMNARMTISGTPVMFSDNMPGNPFIVGTNMDITFLTDSYDEIKKVYDRLADGGDIHMPLQETFWAKGYANLHDKFGVGWQLSTNESMSQS